MSFQHEGYQMDLQNPQGRGRRGTGPMMTAWRDCIRAKTPGMGRAFLDLEAKCRQNCPASFWSAGDLFLLRLPQALGVPRGAKSP